MSQPLPPFSCTHSSNMPELLSELNCTLAISTYQAGKVIFISAINRNKLIQLPRNFSKPMGIAIDKTKLAVATHDKVIVFGNAQRMAGNYPKQPNTHDALFLPRATYFTGEVDLHDLAWMGEKLLAVNTQFSCLAEVDEKFSFKPIWKPPFIKKVTPRDHCHLNGVTFKDNEPVYATALGESDDPEGWRANKLNGGVLIDIPNNEVIVRSLAMPHSPRLYKEGLFVLLSATGQLIQVDPSTRKVGLTKSLDGFSRGMDRMGDHLFIGLSKLRENSSAFRDLPIAKKSIFCGVAVVHLPSASIVGHIRYENSVEEIYDVKVLPGVRRATIVSHEKEDSGIAITTPDTDYWVFPGEQPNGTP